MAIDLAQIDLADPAAGRAHVASQGAPMASTARAGRFPVCHFLCQTNLQCLGQLDPAKLPGPVA